MGHASRWSYLRQRPIGGFFGTQCELPSAVLHFHANPSDMGADDRLGGHDSMRAKHTERQLSLPLGAQFVDALQQAPFDEVRALAKTPEAQRIFDSVQYTMEEESLPNFLHSAMCAMSLPVRRPSDEDAPIIRRDGKLSLIIQPLERMEPNGPNGEFVPVRRGVPFGRHARLVLIYIMTEAVRTRSRTIFLGSSFSAWLRKMGISNTDSGGRRGTRSLVQEQIDRLMNCEWTMRWDETVPVPADKGRGRKSTGAEPAAINAFAINDMRLVNQYGGVRTAGGEFVTHFVLSEAFFDNLIKHSVPLNDRAIVTLQKSATQLDLYTWLAYRLPRIKPGDEVRLSWADLAKHLGNESSKMFKFRQTVRGAWQEVSGVYQQARHCVDLGDLIIKLRHAPPPVKGHLVKLDPNDTGVVTINPLPVRDRATRDLAVAKPDEQAGLPSPELRALPSSAVRFPEGDHLNFTAPELHRIGAIYGNGNAVSVMAAAFRKKLGAELETLEGQMLIDRWKAYVSKWGTV